MNCPAHLFTACRYAAQGWIGAVFCELPLIWVGRPKPLRRAAGLAGLAAGLAVTAAIRSSWSAHACAALSALEPSPALKFYCFAARHPWGSIALLSLLMGGLFLLLARNLNCPSQRQFPWTARSRARTPGAVDGGR